MNQSSQLFCFGFGYTAQVFATHMYANLSQVVGTTRAAEKAEQLKEDGYQACIYPTDDTAMLHALVQESTHILISIPPKDEGDAVFRDFAETITNSEKLQWLGYLSTTGVYGDSGGDWVDETSPTKPQDARTQRRVKAEQQWLSLCEQSVPVHVFRLAGIYGDGRSAINRVQEGSARRIIKPNHQFSRIHVLDIARVLEASIHKPHAGEIYNLCDDMAAPGHEVTEYACDLLKMPYPEAEDFESAPMSEMMRSFFAPNRLVSNQKIKNEFGLELAYPNYREGLSAILERV